MEPTPDPTTDWFGLVNTTIQTLTGLATVIAAVVGVTAWKKQLRNTEDHGLVRDLLLASYRLRDGLQFIRNPFMQLRDRDENGERLSDQGRHEERFKEYDRRVREAASRRSELEVKVSEAEALWGEPVRTWFVPLIERHAELVTEVEMYLDLSRPDMSPLSPENTKLLRDAQKVIYSRSHREPDEFDQKVIAALDQIREKLKPRMVPR